MEVFDVIQKIYEYLTNGIYDFIVEFMSFFIIWYYKLKFTVALSSLSFAWDIAQQLMVDLSITAFLDNMYSGFNNQTLNMLLFFRIPDCINLFINGYLTVFVFKFLVGMKVF